MCACRVYFLINLCTYFNIYNIVFTLKAQYDLNYVKSAFKPQPTNQPTLCTYLLTVWKNLCTLSSPVSTETVDYLSCWYIASFSCQLSLLSSVGREMRDIDSALDLWRSGVVLCWPCISTRPVNCLRPFVSLVKQVTMAQKWCKIKTQFH